MMYARICEAGAYAGIHLKAEAKVMFEIIEKILEASTTGLDINFRTEKECEEDEDDTV